jgi:transposase
VLLSPGNHNEQRYLIPLLDELAKQCMVPAELWADRGYASARHETVLAQRGIRSQISQPRKRGQAIPAGARTRVVYRGKQRRVKVADPNARHRWPVERCIAWLKALRRIATRRDRKASNYLAFLRLGLIVVLLRAI